VLVIRADNIEMYCWRTVHGVHGRRGAVEAYTASV
jgi:hypothetical protein